MNQAHNRRLPRTDLSSILAMLMQTMQQLHCPGHFVPTKYAFNPVKHSSRFRPATRRIVSSAAVTHSAKELYEALETAALELRRAPPSLVRDTPGSNDFD